MKNRSWPAMPYPGLRPFDISADHDESAIFFGRKKQIYELIDRLATSHFIAVLGPSGCGKSSLIRAGVIPGLEKGYLDRAGARWTPIVMEPGGHPVRALATGLCNALVEVVADGRIPDPFASEEIELRMKHRPDALVTFFEDPEVAAVFGPDRNVLILVDQFEELFRPDMTAEPDAQQFINLLLNVYHDPPRRLYIILTMRTDFIKQSACYPGLPTVLSRTMCLIEKIDKMGLREAITEPVKLTPYHGEICDDLTGWILDQMDTDGPYDPDLLPLMQHALLWGWQQTLHKTQPATEDKSQSETIENTVLKREDFSSFTDLADCLSKHADAIYNGLAAEQQRIAEVMFRLLCDVLPDGTKIRRVTSVDEIAAVAECEKPEDLRTVIDAFMSNGAGFIRWKDEGSMIDVSHESFIRKWYRFDVWADLEVKKAKRYLKVLSRAHDRQETGLLNRLELDYYSQWFKAAEPTAAWATRYQFRHKDDKEPATRFSDVQSYLNDSEAACRKEEQEKRKKKKLIRSIILLTGVVIVLSLIIIPSIYFAWYLKTSLTAENYLKTAKESLSQGKATDKDQYEQILSGMIRNAEEALKIDNELQTVWLPEIAKNSLMIKNRPVECHIIKARAYLLKARLAGSLEQDVEDNILDSFNNISFMKDRSVYSLLVEMIKIHLDSNVAEKETRARKVYKIFEDSKITDMSLYTEIAGIFNSKGLEKEALEQYEYVYKNGGNKDFETLMGMGDIYYKKKEYAKAIEKFEEVQKLTGNNPIVQIRLSEIYSTMNDSNNAIAFLETVRDDPRACPILVKEYFKAAQERLRPIEGLQTRGNTATARQYLLKIKNLTCLADPLQGYYARKGGLLMALQEAEALEDAIEAFEEAIQIQEKAGVINPEPYFMLASAYAQKKDYPSAIKYYAQVITINKNDFRALRGLAYCLEKQGEHAEASGKLKESERVEPWRPFAADTAERNMTTLR